MHQHRAVLRKGGGPSLSSPMGLTSEEHRALGQAGQREGRQRTDGIVEPGELSQESVPPGRAVGDNLAGSPQLAVS